MKQLLISVLTILSLHSAFSQKDIKKTIVNDIVKTFKWDIQKEKRGTLMFLDVPYGGQGKGNTEYLSLTVAKDNSNKRPEFISIIVTNKVVQSKGLFVNFGNTVIKDGKRTIELQKDKPINVIFEKCDDEICTARILNGYITSDNGDKVDIFQQFQTFDHVFFEFTNSDYSIVSVAVPLFSFKQQYKNL